MRHGENLLEMLQRKAIDGPPERAPHGARSDPGESVTDRKIRQTLGYRKLKKPGQWWNDHTIWVSDCFVKWSARWGFLVWPFGGGSESRIWEQTFNVFPMQRTTLTASHCGYGPYGCELGWTTPKPAHSVPNCWAILCWSLWMSRALTNFETWNLGPV